MSEDEPEFKREQFMAEREVLVREFGMVTEIDGKTVYYLPCVTWQKLMNVANVLERTNAPRYFNGMLGCWFSPPDILEEELKDLGFKWAWNQFGECDHCPSNVMCRK